MGAGGTALKPLRMRVVVILLAALLIGLAPTYLALSLWVQQHFVRKDRLTFAAAAWTWIETLHTRAQGKDRPMDDYSAPELQAAALVAAKRYAVDLIIVDHAGQRQVHTEQFALSSSVPEMTPVPFNSEITPVPFNSRDSTVHIFQGREYAAFPWAKGYVIVWRPVAQGLAWVMQWHRMALSFFVLGTLLAAGLAYLFLRRMVLLPLGRLDDLLEQGDPSALSHFGAESGHDFAHLGHHVVAMTERIASDRQHIAQQLRDLQQAHAALEAQSAALIRAERLAVVGQMSAGLAHEIGNPLAVLSGYVELLQAENMPQDARTDALMRMQRELDRMQSTLRHLLDFSRATTSTGPADLRDVLHHVSSLLRMHANMRHVTLNVVFPSSTIQSNNARSAEDSGHTELWVCMEPDALIQVLLNICLNAADAMADDTHHTRHRPKTIDIVVRALDVVNPGGQVVHASNGSAQIVVQIDDSGPGIPEELMQRVFDPFFTTKPAGKGTGLGLSVCERLITSAGGQISIGSSRRLGGASVTIMLTAMPATTQ